MAIPDNIYSGICAADLAKYDGRAMGASLAGLINGFGGFGPFIGSPITGYVKDLYGPIVSSY